MMIDGLHERLDDRLERLAKLHSNGDLDDDEFRAAKAQVLGTPVTGVEAPITGVDGAMAVHTLGQFRWRTWFLIALCFGFFFACLSAAVTTLQQPAAPILCSSGDYVAGNVAEQYGGTTSYNIDAWCVNDNGLAHHVSQLAIVGVLWLEYTLALCIAFAILVWVIRGLRGPPRVDVSS